MNEDFVSYELAVKLKECGFDEPCDHYYTPNKAMRIVKGNVLAPETANNRFLDEIADGCCAAIPLWHAQKWLREKKNIHVYPTLESVNEVVYDCKVVYLRKEAYRLNKHYPNYNQALTEGIKSALELIKKGE